MAEDAAESGSRKGPQISKSRSGRDALIGLCLFGAVLHCGSEIRPVIEECNELNLCFNCCSIAASIRRDFESQVNNLSFPDGVLPLRVWRPWRLRRLEKRRARELRANDPNRAHRRQP